MKIDPVLRCVMSASSISLATLQSKLLESSSCIASMIENEFPGITNLSLNSSGDEIVASKMSFRGATTSSDMYFVERAAPHPEDTPYLYSFAVGYDMLNDNGKAVIEAARANPGAMRRSFFTSTSVDSIDMAGYEAAMDACNFIEAAKILSPFDPERTEAMAASLERVRPIVKDGRISINSDAGLKDFSLDIDTLSVTTRGQQISVFTDLPGGLGELTVAHANDCGAYIEIFVNFDTEELEDAEMLKAA